MKKADVLAYFEGNQARVARELKLSRMAVSKWGEVVPLEPARALEILTEGGLQVDESLYPQLQRATEAVAARGAA